MIIADDQGRLSAAEVDTNTAFMLLRRIAGTSGAVYRTTLFGSWFTALLGPAASVWEAQFWFQQRCRLFDLVEGVPSEATTCPAAATQHLAPVTLDDPIDFTRLRRFPATP
jgi:hypothetical protein